MMAEVNFTERELDAFIALEQLNLWAVMNVGSKESDELMGMVAKIVNAEIETCAHITETLGATKPGQMAIIEGATPVLAATNAARSSAAMIRARKVEL